MLNISADNAPVQNSILKAEAYEKLFHTNLCLKNVTVREEHSNGIK